MEELLSAGIVVFRRTGNFREFLILHYPHGHWDFPKGKIEQGETKQQAAIREVEEETGLSINIIEGFEENITYVFNQNGEPAVKKVYFFLGEAPKGDVKISEEHVDFKWLPYESALKQLTFNNAKIVFQRVKEYLDN